MLPKEMTLVVNRKDTGLRIFTGGTFIEVYLHQTMIGRVKSIRTVEATARALSNDDVSGYALVLPFHVILLTDEEHINLIAARMPPEPAQELYDPWK